MALTINTTPDAISSIYSFGGIIFNVSSNDVTIERLKVEVQKNTGSWVTVATFEQDLNLGSTTTFDINIKTFLSLRS